ncbi:MAG: ABC transporter ATP-binding protein [Candidatus Thermoplasmatota archaeon]|jgi:ABC-2 type transport system ATP-binding protein|nr:ABC transporter ATP-binding protein [Candidatus Thermoplasmatota archaeon]MCL5987515.1 ABC transporter ATP-binding protein [Candidatus Thermoplasmatota archaeon]
MPDYDIEIEGLRKSYDGKKYALDGLSFNTQRGEIYGLLGKNGAGKSTSIKIMTTLIGYNEGTVTVAGLDVKKDASKIRKKIGVVQQEESFDFTTVENNFKLTAMMWEVPREQRDARMEELMELFGLSEIRKKRMFDLSGGQKKRVQVAREFIHDMKVIFLDEPTVGLDPIMRRKILEYIRGKARNGLTVLFTTQNLEEADMICDRIGIINEGRIVEEGTSNHLKNKYGNLRTLTIWTNSNKKITKDGILEMFSSMNFDEIEYRDSVITIITRNLEKNLSGILNQLSGNGISVERINVENPTLDDVFIKVVQK